MQIQENLTFEKVWAMFQETREQMKETDRRIGELSNRFGELAEHLVVPNIKEKFSNAGLKFEDISSNREIIGPEGRFLAEIDILLENRDLVIAIEVKAKPKNSDVDDHIKRMEILRNRANERNDKRKYFGAVAGAIMNQNMRDYILENGFYLIEQTGDTVKLTIPEGFTPKEW